MEREYRPSATTWSMNCTPHLTNVLALFGPTFFPACGPLAIASRSGSSSRAARRQHHLDPFQNPKRDGRPRPYRRRGSHRSSVALRRERRRRFRRFRSSREGRSNDHHFPWFPGSSRLATFAGRIQKEIEQSRTHQVRTMHPAITTGPWHGGTTLLPRAGWRPQTRAPHRRSPVLLVC